MPPPKFREDLAAKASIDTVYHFGFPRNSAGWMNDRLGRPDNAGLPRRQDPIRCARPTESGLLKERACPMC